MSRKYVNIEEKAQGWLFKGITVAITGKRKYEIEVMDMALVLNKIQQIYLHIPAQYTIPAKMRINLRLILLCLINFLFALDVIFFLSIDVFAVIHYIQHNVGTIYICIFIVYLHQIYDKCQ